MTTGRPPLRRSWVASDRPVARLIARPLREFLQTEAAGGILLLAAALIALVWANSPLAGAYRSLWGTEIVVRIGDFEIAADVRHWVNDGLMAIFFFVVGLEIKRELIVGELNDRRKAALPALAALGGMVVPAVIYIAINFGGEGVRGWGIPMATDIAFAVGVLAVLGRRCPDSLRVFLLSLAIVDDIGAILVIALFYSGGIKVSWLICAVVLLVVVSEMRRRRIWWTPLYVVVGFGVWLATFESGIHATIAGVALGLIAPARPSDPEGAGDALREASAFTRDPEPAAVRRVTIQAKEAVSIAERLEHMLHPWTSFGVIPLFALANAGVRLNANILESATSSPVTLGIIAGLVAGKLIGIITFSWASTRLRIGAMPEGMTWHHLVGGAAVAGIGFTVSLFIAGLAFADQRIFNEAMIGIFAGSIVAALVGVTVLMSTAREG